MGDTIFALASARGRAGIAVVRLSGPGAFAAAETLAGPLPPLRKAGLRRIIWQGDVLDEGIVIAFAPGVSFTGESVVELQLHGSVAIVRAVLAALGAMPGLRLAEPGEFTRRALENGKLDLTQVEGLADLIDAETEAQRRQAHRVLSGAIGQRVALWRADLIRAAALMEATIDFADEDVPVDVTPEVRGLLSGLLTRLRAETAAGQAAERVRTGFEVAIVGSPNVGKSTLLNHLAGREVAITSAVAGTTRDVIEVRLELDGLPVTLLDTAGIRETADEVEQIGIARAMERAAQADLRVFLVEAADEPLALPRQPMDVVVLAKADARGTVAGAVSGKTGAGVAEMLATIGGHLRQMVVPDGVLIRTRHVLAIRDAMGALESAAFRLELPSLQAELVASDLRAAILALETLMGRVGVEDLLGEIFTSFCIGK